jgi:hypothetical protein
MCRETAKNKGFFHVLGVRAVTRPISTCSIFVRANFVAPTLKLTISLNKALEISHFSGKISVTALDCLRPFWQRHDEKRLFQPVWIP